MQNRASSNSLTIVSPVCELLREPFVRLKIIEGKDIYINRAKKKQNGDLYAKITYGSSTMFKTQVLQKTAFPIWNKTFEIDRVSEVKLEQNPFIISIYDSDPLGTDELISTLILPVNYFVEKKMHDKPIDIWAQLTTAGVELDKENHGVQSNHSYDDGLIVPSFENEIITGDEPKMANPGKVTVTRIISDIQKIHISLEIYDEINLKHVRLEIVDTEEAKEKGSLFKFFIYTVKIIRNDGLEWVVKRRYKEMRELKEKLEKAEIQIKFDFPAKDMLKFLSYFMASQEESYRKQCEERKQKLEDFLNYLAKIPYIYNFEAFNNFFTAD